MRAKEFIIPKQRTDEIAPIIAAIGQGLLRGGAALGNAITKGAASAIPKVGQIAKNAGSSLANVGKQALGTVGTKAASSLGQTLGTNLGNNLSGTTPSLPAGTKIQPVPSKPGDKPNSIRLKIGDTEMILDDPAALQQLGQLGVAK